MARRKKSSLQRMGLVWAMVLLVIALLGARLFRSAESESFRTVAVLDIPAYLENANSLRGNTYKIEGEISNVLAWSPTSGRLIAVNVEDDVIPVLVTTAFQEKNIQKGQKFFFVLEVDEKGTLKTKNMSQR